jgi:hypothetical protein
MKAEVMASRTVNRNVRIRMTISLAPFDSQSASLWQADYSLRAFDVM